MCENCKSYRQNQLALVVPLFLGSLLSRRAQYCSYLSFSGWPFIFMFSFGSAQHALGRPQDRLAAASPVRAAGCRGLHVRRAWRSLFFVFTLLHACRLSGQPSFSACFSAFLDGDSKVCVCVCVCVCVSDELIHAPAFVLVCCVWLWVVVYAPTGPGASFSETPFSRPWT